MTKNLKQNGNNNSSAGSRLQASRSLAALLQILRHEFPDIAGAAAEQSLGRIERRPEDIGGLDLGWNDQLHPVGQHVEESRAGLGQPVADRGLEIRGLLDAPRLEADRLRH